MLKKALLKRQETHRLAMLQMKDLFEEEKGNQYFETKIRSYY